MATRIASSPTNGIDVEAVERNGFPSNADAGLSDEEVGAAWPDPEAEVLLAELVGNPFEAGTDDERLETESPLDHGRGLTEAELSSRLARQVLPSLRSRAEWLGYLSVGHLARAVFDLQGSASHLAPVRDLVSTLDVPIVTGGALRGPRSNPPWAIDLARRLFHEVIQARPDEALVVRRLGYADIPLSQATRAFLVEAWLGHTLSRADEHSLAAVVAAEVERVGTDISRWSAEAQGARETLVLDNLWLCARTARLYVGRGIEVDDLLQSAAEGLFRAVPRFDPNRGIRFASYAGSWVFQSIARAIADTSRLIRLPVHMHDRERRVEEARESLRITRRRESSLAEIASEAGVPESLVHAHLMTSRPVSLDAPAHTERIRNLPSGDEAIEEASETADLRLTINNLLLELSERERAVVERRFGLNDGEPETLDAIGQDLGVTRERIRQIEEKSLGKLRHPSLAIHLAAYAPTGSTTIDGVSQATAKAVMGDLDPTDRAIAVGLWELASQGRASEQAVARRLLVPLNNVRRVSAMVVQLARARAVEAASQGEAVLARQSEAAPLQVLPQARERSLHRGWLTRRLDLDEPPTIAPTVHPTLSDDLLDALRALRDCQSAPRIAAFGHSAPEAAARGSELMASEASEWPDSRSRRPIPAAARLLPEVPSIPEATPAEVLALRGTLSAREWRVAAALWGLDGRSYRTLRDVVESQFVDSASVKKIARAVVAKVGQRRAQRDSPTTGPVAGLVSQPHAEDPLPPLVTPGHGRLDETTSIRPADALPARWPLMGIYGDEVARLHPSLDRREWRVATLLWGIDGEDQHPTNAVAHLLGEDRMAVQSVARRVVELVKAATTPPRDHGTPTAAHVPAVVDDPAPDEDEVEDQVQTPTPSASASQPYGVGPYVPGRTAVEYATTGTLTPVVAEDALAALEAYAAARALKIAGEPFRSRQYDGVRATLDDGRVYISRSLAEHLVATLVDTSATPLAPDSHDRLPREVEVADEPEPEDDTSIPYRPVDDLAASRDVLIDALRRLVDLRTSDDPTLGDEPVIDVVEDHVSSPPPSNVALPTLRDQLDDVGWAAVTVAVLRLPKTDHQVAVARTGLDGSHPLTRRAAARLLGRSEGSVYILDRILLREIRRVDVETQVWAYWEHLERPTAPVVDGSGPIRTG